MSRIAPLLLGAALAATSLPGQGITYPATRRDTTADRYFGTPVPAPYRWMEDQNSPEVAAWVDSENAVTFRYLDGVTLRGAFKDRLTALWNYARVTVPDRPTRGGGLFFTKNSGLQSQSPIYEQTAPGSRPRLVLDPNTLSPDGSVALSTWSVSPDGRYLAYGLSPGGSDWRDLHVRDLATGKDLADTVRWAKFSGASWTRDGHGFFYSRFPAPAADQVLTAAPLNQKVYYHVLGTPDSTDRMVFAQPGHPEWYVSGFVTEDGRYLILSYGNATDRNHVSYADLGDPMHPNVTAEVKPLFTAYDASYRVIGDVRGTFLVRTTNDAPKGRIVAVDPADPGPGRWRVVVPEGPNLIEGAVMAGGRIVVQDLADVRARLRLFSTEGRALGEIPLPGIGAVSGLSARADTPELFYGFTSFLRPATVYRFDLISRRTTPFQAPRVAFNAAAYETTQVWYTSKDGTRVPMFVTAKKGLALDGSHPTVLYAYGGFDIDITPAFSPAVAVWLEHGGVYAVPNLRGGGEFGEAWHHAGMLERKQNVFDDFIAAAEYLIKAGYTSSAHLAIHGYSNGGLLVGAVEDQRPDLFAAAYPGAGVMDMLRYQTFTAGKGWVPEYGSSDDSAQFAYLIRYSPVQNVKPGTCYPATIITTADHDDRVVPSHSYKFAAALQAAQRCDRPALIRVDTKTSHGYMPTDKRIAELADVLGVHGLEHGDAVISRREAVAAAAGALVARVTLPVSAAGSREPSPPGEEGAYGSRPAAPGRLRQSLARWCYGSIPLPDLCRAARTIGLAGIDLLARDEWDIVRDAGLVCSMGYPYVKERPDFIATGFNDPANHALLLGELEDAIPLAAAHGVPNVITMFGNRKGRSDAEGIANCIAGLKRIAPAAEAHQVTVCVELLNSKVDHHDYQGDHTAFGAAVIDGVGSPRVKLLYDIYHMQIMEGDVIRTVREHASRIAHFHTGGVPGRHELDDTQELDYRGIARAIADLGFTGYLAHEFEPSRDPLTSLEEAVETCTV